VAKSAKQPTSHGVFICHASIDSWVARQLAAKAEACGARAFLDGHAIEHGDDFEVRLREGANDCAELLVLLTPTALRRRYVWLEIGMFFGAGKRIVTALYGVTTADLARAVDVPVLKRLDAVALEDIDSYFTDLAQRVHDLKKPRNV